MRKLHVSAVLFWATLAIRSICAQPGEAEAAVLQRSLPQAELNHTHYLSLARVAPERREDLAIAIKLAIAQTSRQPVLERCTPKVASDVLLKINIRELGWDKGPWKELITSSPYKAKHVSYPLVIRADWLLVQIADQQESDAYMKLLYGKNPPATRDEALKALGVSTKAGTRTDHRNFGVIEGDSQVAVNKARWIENRPAKRGYAWGTRDVTSLTQKTDPLENLTGQFKHDGEEWIIGMPKVSTTTGARGTLQAYFLANGQGKIVPRAPVDLVADSAKFRGLTEIRNPGSCIVCHASGINETSDQNELRELLLSGGRVKAKLKKVSEQIEAFHLGRLDKEIQRNQEDFQAAVRIVCGCEADVAASSFKAAVEYYDEPLDLERAAMELYVEPGDLRDAIAYASANKIAVSARIVGLAHGRTVPRETWEEQYLAVKKLIQLWRQ